VRVAQELQAQGIKINTGTIVDATIIGAPSSTKHADRDPEMHQTRKGQQWYFGMKLHIGVGSLSVFAAMEPFRFRHIGIKEPLNFRRNGASWRATPSFIDGPPIARTIAAGPGSRTRRRGPRSRRASVEKRGRQSD
jgi:hypothetical protein